MSYVLFEKTKNKEKILGFYNKYHNAYVAYNELKSKNKKEYSIKRIKFSDELRRKQCWYLSMCNIIIYGTTEKRIYKYLVSYIRQLNNSIVNKFNIRILFDSTVNEEGMEDKYRSCEDVIKPINTIIEAHKHLTNEEVLQELFSVYYKNI